MNEPIELEVGDTVCLGTRDCGELDDRRFTVAEVDHGNRQYRLIHTKTGTESRLWWWSFDGKYMTNNTGNNAINWDTVVRNGVAMAKITWPPDTDDKYLSWDYI